MSQARMFRDLFLLVVMAARASQLFAEPAATLETIDPLSCKSLFADNDATFLQRAKAHAPAHLLSSGSALRYERYLAYLYRNNTVKLEKSLKARAILLYPDPARWARMLEYMQKFPSADIYSCPECSWAEALGKYTEEIEHLDSLTRRKRDDVGGFAAARHYLMQVPPALLKPRHYVKYLISAPEADLADAINDLKKLSALQDESVRKYLAEDIYDYGTQILRPQDIGALKRNREAPIESYARFALWFSTDAKHGRDLIDHFLRRNESDERKSQSSYLKMVRQLLDEPSKNVQRNFEAAVTISMNPFDDESERFDNFPYILSQIFTLSESWQSALKTRYLVMNSHTQLMLLRLMRFRKSLSPDDLSFARTIAFGEGDKDVKNEAAGVMYQYYATSHKAIPSSESALFLRIGTLAPHLRSNLDSTLSKQSTIELLGNFVRLLGNLPVEDLSTYGTTRVYLDKIASTLFQHSDVETVFRNLKSNQATAVSEHLRFIIASPNLFSDDTRRAARLCLARVTNINTDEIAKLAEFSKNDIINTTVIAEGLLSHLSIDSIKTLAQSKLLENEHVLRFMLSSPALREAGFAVISIEMTSVDPQDERRLKFSATNITKAVQSTKSWDDLHRHCIATKDQNLAIYIQASPGSTKSNNSKNLAAEAPRATALTQALLRLSAPPPPELQALRRAIQAKDEGAIATQLKQSFFDKFKFDDSDLHSLLSSCEKAGPIRTRMQNYSNPEQIFDSIFSANRLNMGAYRLFEDMIDARFHDFSPPTQTEKILSVILKKLTSPEQHNEDIKNHLLSLYLKVIRAASFNLNDGNYEIAVQILKVWRESGKLSKEEEFSICTEWIATTETPMHAAKLFSTLRSFMLLPQDRIPNAEEMKPIQIAWQVQMDIQREDASSKSTLRRAILLYILHEQVSGFQTADVRDVLLSAAVELPSTSWLGRFFFEASEKSHKFLLHEALFKGKQSYVDYRDILDQADPDQVIMERMDRLTALHKERSEEAARKRIGARDTEAHKKIRPAMDELTTGLAVKQILESGWLVYDQSSNTNLGFDLLAKNPRTGETKTVELKGKRPNWTDTEISQRQIEVATESTKQSPGRAILHIVEANFETYAFSHHFFEDFSFERLGPDAKTGLNETLQAWMISRQALEQIRISNAYPY